MKSKISSWYCLIRELVEKGVLFFRWLCMGGRRLEVSCWWRCRSPRYMVEDEYGLIFFGGRGGMEEGVVWLETREDSG